jgi:hypothetical protein
MDERLLNRANVTRAIERAEVELDAEVRSEGAGGGPFDRLRERGELRARGELRERANSGP